MQAAYRTQTTILPTARTSLSMAAHGAIPKRFANIHPRYLTPSTSTIGATKKQAPVSAPLPRA